MAPPDDEAQHEHAQLPPPQQQQLQQQISVVFPGGPDLRTEPFERPDNPLRVGKAWEEWLEDIEEAMDYHSIQMMR